jgi:hypothetical protein
MNDDPLRKCLQDAMAALLRGDTAERDRIIARGRQMAYAQDKAPPIELVRQEDGSYKPKLKTH